MNRHRYTWEGTALLYNGCTTGLGIVSAAPEFPGLWWVQYPDGSLSDFTNLTRAKDAASYWHASTSRQDRARRAAGGVAA
jgi:hypothetical protein